MLAEAITPHCTGPDRVFGHDNSWGLGFGIDDDGYGMGGHGGNYGGICTAGGYAIGFVTGHVGSFDRLQGLGTPAPYQDNLAIVPVSGHRGRFGGHAGGHVSHGGHGGGFGGHDAGAG